MSGAEFWSGPKYQPGGSSIRHGVAVPDIQSVPGLAVAILCLHARQMGLLEEPPLAEHVHRYATDALDFVSNPACLDCGEAL